MLILFACVRRGSFLDVFPGLAYFLCFFCLSTLRFFYAKALFYRDSLEAHLGVFASVVSFYGFLVRMRIGPSFITFYTAHRFYGFFVRMRIRTNIYYFLYRPSFLRLSYTYVNSNIGIIYCVA